MTTLKPSNLEATWVRSPRAPLPAMLMLACFQNIAVTYRCCAFTTSLIRESRSVLLPLPLDTNVKVKLFDCCSLTRCSHHVEVKSLTPKRRFTDRCSHKADVGQKTTLVTVHANISCHFTATPLSTGIHSLLFDSKKGNVLCFVKYSLIWSIRDKPIQIFG